MSVKTSYIRDLSKPGQLPATCMIVMIPCLNEPEIIRTLESLWNCDFPESACETIVVVNESENSLEEVKVANEKTYVQLLQWKQQNDRAGMVLYPILCPFGRSKVGRCRHGA